MAVTETAPVEQVIRSMNVYGRKFDENISNKFLKSEKTTKYFYIHLRVPLSYN